MINSVWSVTDICEISKTQAKVQTQDLPNTKP